jgi:hypothetical protein
MITGSEEMAGSAWERALLEPADSRLVPVQPLTVQPDRVSEDPQVVPQVLRDHIHVPARFFGRPRNLFA